MQAKIKAVKGVRCVHGRPIGGGQHVGVGVLAQAERDGRGPRGGGCAFSLSEGSI